MHGRAVLISIMICLAGQTSAEFRIWTDRAGNSIEAELIKTIGDKVVLRDRKGRTHKIDPAKLSDEDQSFLNLPPPVRYELTFAKKSQEEFVEKTVGGLQVREKTGAYLWEFTMWVKREDGRELDQGLTGQFLAFGKDVVDHSYLVIDKVEALVKMVENVDEIRGEVRGDSFKLVLRRDDNGEPVEGTKYAGYLVVLLSSDGRVLAKKGSHRFLDDHDKVMALSVGDHFDKPLLRARGKE